jgi:hypothetical protein
MRTRADYPDDPFRGRHEEGEVILCCVRWYLDFPLRVAGSERKDIFRQT